MGAVMAQRRPRMGEPWRTVRQRPGWGCQPRMVKPWRTVGQRPGRVCQHAFDEMERLRLLLFFEVVA